MRDLAGLIDRLVDAGIGALAALWPRSVAAREVTRLADEGHAVGAFHEVLFTVSLDDDAPDNAVATIQAAGFTVREETGSRPHLTVAARMPLTSYHLHVTTARLQRLLVPYGGFAAPIGPVRRRPLVPTDEVRVPGIESSPAS
jgi:hypothetical protein